MGSTGLCLKLKRTKLEQPKANYADVNVLFFCDKNKFQNKIHIFSLKGVKDTVGLLNWNVPEVGFA